jgi:excisionase family DNA binding protein
MTQQQTSSEVNRGLIGIGEAADLLGVSKRQLYLWLSSGRLPPGIVFRPSRRVYFLRGKLLQWIGAAQSDGGSRP